MSDNFVRRFLLEDLDIRGAFVQVGSVWRDMQAGRGYPPPVASLLGEMAATTALLGANLKQAGRITFQLRGTGPVSLLVLDCNEQLALRGMAKCAERVEPGPVPELLGGGQLLLSLDLAQMREPYQSYVPLDGDSIAEVFEHFLAQSEQQPSRLFLAASADAAAGLFLQKLPTADERDADGWARVEQLASTVRPQELLTLSAEELLTRLFNEETVRLFAPQAVSYNCPEDKEKIRSMLRSLGRDEIEAMLREQGEIVIKDDICNREYRFDAQAVEALFTETPPTLH